jgi:hypothetical protein
MEQYSFTKKGMDRLIPFRFKINYWLLQKLGLFGFAFLAFLWGVVCTIVVLEIIY